MTVIISEPLRPIVPASELPGLRTTARGFRLAVRGPHGRKILASHFAGVPTLDQLRSRIPVNGLAWLEQAMYQVGGRTAYTRIAQFYAVPDTDVLAQLGEVQKAAADINTSAGASMYVDTMHAKLMAAVNAQTTEALNAAILALREFRGTLTPAAQAAVAEQMGSNYQRAIKDIENSPAVVMALRKGGVQVVQAAKQSMISTMKAKEVLSSAPNAQDKAQVEYMQNTTGFFVKDEYGKRPQYVADQAKQIMAASLDQQMGREAMAVEMKQQLGASLGRKDDAYWHTVADNYTTRARSWGNMSSMHEAGFEFFRIEAILDEATTDTCRFLHGKELSLPAAMNTMFQGSMVANAEQMDAVNPFIREQKMPGGGVMLNVPVHAPLQPGGSAPKPLGSKTIATTGSSARGQWDQTGSWQGITAEDIQALNIGAPPYHHRCRTTIVPTGKPAQPRVVPGLQMPVPPKAVPPRPPAAAAPGKAYNMKAPAYAPSKLIEEPPDDAVRASAAYWQKRRPAEEADWNAHVEKAQSSGLNPQLQSDFRKIAHDFVRTTGRAKKPFGEMVTPKGSIPSYDDRTVSLQKMSAGQRTAMQEVQDEVNALVDKRTVGGKTIRTQWYKEQQTGGANYIWTQPNAKAHRLSINADVMSYDYFKDNYSAAMAHELGHSVQAASPQVRALQQAIVKTRLEKYPDFLEVETPVPPPVPGVTYKAPKLLRREYQDKFVNSYAGAQHAGKDGNLASGWYAGMEFTSVGMEYFFTNPMRLFLCDPEHFYFMTAILRGLV